jgi:hypothetical protein
MTTEIYPRRYASTSADTVAVDTALLLGPFRTMVYDMPSNTAIVQYQLVKLAASALAVIAGAPSAGDICGVAVEAVDNLTATAAQDRRATAVVYVLGEFNENKIVVTGSTVAAWRAVANASGIQIVPVLAFPG